MSYRIAIAAYGRWLDNPIADDSWLTTSLQARGHQVEMLDWQLEPSPALHAFDAIFVSSTWNFIDNPDGFVRWLEACESDGKTRLINSRALLLRGIKKYDYLLPLLKKYGEESSPTGSVIPSRFFVQDGSATPDAPYLQAIDGSASFIDIVASLPDDWQGQALVIKPVTSASSLNTFVYSEQALPHLKPEHWLETIFAADDVFQRLLQLESTNGVMVQRYMPAVEEGEYSLIFFHDTFSHAIQKPAGFRPHFEGRRVVETLPAQMLEFAQQLIADMQADYGNDALTRTRVDLFRGAQGPILSELEFVEPHTNILVINRDKGEAARQAIIENFATAIEQRIAQF